MANKNEGWLEQSLKQAFRRLLCCCQRSRPWYSRQAVETVFAGNGADRRPPGFFGGIQQKAFRDGFL